MWSLAPFMNFVRLCTTTSAPSWIGAMISGVKVLSTTSTAPCRCAMSASLGRSAIRRVGFDTDSQKRILVRGVIARSTAARSETSTNVVETPALAGR